MPSRPPTRSAPRQSTEVERLKRKVRALEAERARLRETARAAEDLQFSIEDLRNQKEEVQVQNQQLAESQRLLEESRDRYADLFESAPTAFVGIDYNGVIREANAMATTLLGLQRGRLVETPLLLFIEEAYRRAFLAFIRECRRGAAPRIDLVLKLRDGRRVPVELCGSSGTGLSSTEVRYQVAITDLTERKHAVEVREQLQITTASERLLRTVLGSLPVGVQVLNRDGYVVIRNPASEAIWSGEIADTSDWWASLLGWRPGSETPLAPREWPVARALRGETVLSELLVVEGFDRARRTLRASAIPLLGDNGLPNGAVAVCEDITALVRTQTALRASESKARRLVESNIIGVAFFDRAGVITDANDAFLSLSGYTAAEVRACALTWTDLTPPHGAPQTERAVEQLRKRGTCDPFERACLRKDGSEFYAVVGASMLEGGDEGVAFLLDISDRKRAETAMREAKEAAEAANQSKDQFLSTVSHELRTPLSAVLLWAHLLRRGVLQSEAERVEALETIHHSAKAQSRLIDDLLDVSRIISGKLTLDLREQPLAPVIEAVVSAIRPGAAAKNVTVVTHLDSAAQPVAMDRLRMEQVVINLLTNAVKFTPEGGRIQVRLRPSGSTVQLIVADDGIGIDAAFLPHIFERFRQAETTLTRSQGGLGLGLSITSELVRIHGGTIVAESPGLGQGSTFTVTLPAASNGQAARSARGNGARLSEATSPTAAGGGSGAPSRVVAKRGDGSGSSPLEGVRVLVVEDDRNTRAGVAKVLQRSGAKVVTAESAARAFALFRRRRPDVLLSDVAMPGEDGLSLIRRLRAIEQRPAAPRSRPGHATRGQATRGDATRGDATIAPRSTPAIALTALTRPEDEARSLEAGFHAHLAKPVEPAALIALVAKLAGREV